MKETRRKIHKKLEPTDVPYTRVKRVPHSLVLYDYKPLAFYRQNAKKRDGVCDLTYRQYSKVIREIFFAIRHYLIENEGGVYVEEFGYFSTILLKHHDNYKKLNRFVNPNNYGIYLYTDIKPKKCMLFGMNLDRAVTIETKKRFKNKLKSGFLYKCYYTFLKSVV